MKRMILSIVALTIGTLMHAQLSFTEHLMVNQGFSNNYITDIIQDCQGRIWIATDSGLDSFDGIKFKCYNAANSGLSSNMVKVLWFDKARNILWIGTKGKGICVLEVLTGRITPLKIENESLPANNITDITPSQDGQLWIASQNRIFKYNLGNETSAIVPGLAGQYGFYQCILDDGNGNLLIGHRFGGVSIYDVTTREIHRLKSKNGQDYSESVNDMLIDHTGRIWIATSKGLCYYSPGDYTVIMPEDLNFGNILDIEEIDRKELWVSTNESYIWKVSIPSLKCSKVPSLQTMGSPIHDVSKIFQDKAGNVWLGSLGNGIDFFSHEPPGFTLLSHEAVWGIYKDEDGLWVGGNHKVTCIRDSVNTRVIPVGNNLRENGAILSIAGDDQGQLIVALVGHLIRIDKSTGKQSEILTDEGTSIPAHSFFKDIDGTLWVLARDKVYTLHYGKLTAEKELNGILAQTSPNGIRRDKQGKLWITTRESGVYIFDRQKKMKVHLDQQGAFLSNTILHLYMDKKGGLWMATPDGIGYISDTSKPERYQLFSNQNGLKDTYIRAIQEDANGNIWVCSNVGISMLNKKGDSFINYNRRDGVPTSNFTQGALSEGDNMYFTSLDGLCQFSPTSLTKMSKMSELQIISLLGWETNKEERKSTILRPGKDGNYHLEYDRNSFRIVFGLDDYAQNRLAEYQYILENEDKTWTTVDANSITFRNLSPGKYTISIRARLKGMEWNDGHKTAVTVYIQPPFWRTWWALAVYLLIIIALVMTYFRHYKHRLKLQGDYELERKKNLDEKERNTERLQFFTNITHELRTPLTLILAPLEDLRNDESLTGKAKERITIIYNSAEQLKRLVSQLLEFRKTETHNRQLTVSRKDLVHTVREVGRSFSELNTNPQLRYIINTVEPPLPLYYDEEVITMILNNLMGNAAKYTPQGEIELSLTVEGQYATITVRDTGYGIEEDELPHILDRYYQAKGKHQASGTGIGLSLVKSLCTLHDITIKVESKVDTGTKFMIALKRDNTYPEALHKENNDNSLMEEPVTNYINTNDGKPVILIVEDNEEIGKYVCSSLSDDYQVMRASNGKTGYENAISTVPDLIITDVMMPVMDGTEMCRLIKKDIRTSHIPVIMLTAKDMMADQQEGYEAGADSYLTKPFSISMLRSRIINLLTARQRLASWVAMNATQPDSPATEASQLSRLDRQFLIDVTDFIESHITDSSLTMNAVGEHLHISYSTLYRKIKALTGLSSNEFVRKIRLQHSLKLMLEHHRNVSEAAYESGFTDIPYFRNCFKAEFGMPPTEYLKKCK